MTPESGPCEAFDILAEDDEGKTTFQHVLDTHHVLIAALRAERNSLRAVVERAARELRHNSVHESKPQPNCLTCQARRALVEVP